MTSDLEFRVAKLEATEEIRRLKIQYADVCDTGYDPEKLRPLFMRDAGWDGGDKFGRYEGVDAICDFFDGAKDLIPWTVHYMTSSIIDVADNLEAATGRWWLWQAATMVGHKGPQAVWLTAKYDDRYQKEEGAWKFTEVRADVQTLSPIDEGWVHTQLWDEY